MLTGTPLTGTPLTGTPLTSSLLVGDHDEVGVFLMAFILLATFAAHSFFVATVPVSVPACAKRARVVFCPPPQWPSPPAGWVPRADWTSDPSWPSPGVGWSFWRDAQGQPCENPESLLTRRAGRWAVRVDGLILIAAGIIAALAYRNLAGGWSWLMAGCLVAGGLCAIWWSRPVDRRATDPFAAAAAAPTTAKAPTEAIAPRTGPITSPWPVGELVIREDTAMPFVSDATVAAIIARHRELLSLWRRRSLILLALVAGFVTSIACTHSALGAYWALFAVYGVFALVWAAELYGDQQDCRRQPRAGALLSHIRYIRGRVTVERI